MPKKNNLAKINEQDKGLQLWRMVAIFALVFAAAQFAIAVFGVGIKYVMDLLKAGDNVRVFVGSTISRIGMIAAILLITIPVIKSVLKRPGLEGMYPREKGKVFDFAAGFAIAAAALLVVFFIEYGIGFISVSGFALSGEPIDAWLRVIWLAILTNIVAAVGEEVLFRGLLVQGVEITWDKWGALFISAIIFGGSHILVAGARETNWMAFIPLLALPGVMLGWAYLHTGNLWLPTGIHFAWNLFQDDILNLTADHSGDTLFGLVTKLNGPKWFVGTSYGIEVGGAGILCLLLVLAGIWWWIEKKKRMERIDK